MTFVKTDLNCQNQYVPVFFPTKFTFLKRWRMSCLVIFTKGSFTRAWKYLYFPENAQKKGKNTTQSIFTLKRFSYPALGIKINLRKRFLEGTLFALNILSAMYFAQFICGSHSLIDFFESSKHWPFVSPIHLDQRVAINFPYFL